MKDLKTFEFGADAGTLSRAYESGLAPAHLEPVFRAMVSEIVSKVGEGTGSVYLCSPDEDTESRNRFAFLLAKLVRAHVPTALLVDCDFLSAGMNGIIPHRDALGFLDLLLYGTSLGVITQEALHGVKVVGAGSFAVTKKSPFAMDAFVDARRYLVNQAKCAIFVGPAMDDEGSLHPIAENVDRVVLVRMGTRFDARTLDPLEEKIASAQAGEAWSVHINTRTAAPAAREPQETAKEEATLVAEVEDLVDRLSEPKAAPRVEKTRVTSDRVPVQEKAGFADARSAGGDGPLFEEEEELAGPHIRRKSVGTRIIRVVISFVVLVLVAFVVWWLYLTRSVREHGGERAGAVRRTPVAEPPAPVTATDSLRSGRPIEPPPVATEETAPADRAESGVAAGRGETAKSATETAAALQPPETSVSTPDSIHFAATLDEFANQYVVHAGSFKGVDKAKEEAFYLLGWGYAVFIYRVDLESKGVWYRVYVGPFATREDAMERKIKLDENPRIRSTRVSKVPG